MTKRSPTTGVKSMLAKKFPQKPKRVLMPRSPTITLNTKIISNMFTACPFSGIPFG